MQGNKNAQCEITASTMLLY